MRSVLALMAQAGIGGMTVWLHPHLYLRLTQAHDDTHDEAGHD